MLKSQVLLLVMSGAPSAAASPMVANVERARLPSLLLPTQKKMVRKGVREDTRKHNNPILGAARKALRVLEPVLKEAKKACKSPYASQALKDEKGAAETLVKEADAISQDRRCEGVGQESKHQSWSFDKGGWCPQRNR